MEDQLGPVGAFVLDKIAVGVLLIVAGAIASTIAGKWKVEYEYKAELARKSVAEIAVAWQAATAFEAHTNMFVASAVEAHKQGKDALIGLLPLQEENMRLADAMREATVERRFYLGEAHYEALLDFHNALMGLMKAVGDGDPNATFTARQQVERSRVTLQDFVDTPPF